MELLERTAAKHDEAVDRSEAEPFTRNGLTSSGQVRTASWFYANSARRRAALSGAGRAGRIEIKPDTDHADHEAHRRSAQAGRVPS